MDIKEEFIYDLKKVLEKYNAFIEIESIWKGYDVDREEQIFEHRMIVCINEQIPVNLGKYFDSMEFDYRKHRG